MARIPVGVQLYTLRDETAKDFIGTLRRVSEIGYAGVEFAGYGNLSAKELKTVLDDLNLKPCGAHVGLTQLQSDLSGVIDFHLELGNKFVVCPHLPKEVREDKEAWLKLAKQFNGYGEACAKHGLTFCYHNHAFEFERFDGEYALDLLYGATDPKLVKAELDLYWVKKGGASPEAYVKKYAGRVPLLHIKDMAGDAEGSFAEFGEGILDWDAIIPAADAAGVQWYIVEQDVCKRSPFDCVTTSFQNLQARGLA